MKARRSRATVATRPEPASLLAQLRRAKFARGRFAKPEAGQFWRTEVRVGGPRSVLADRGPHIRRAVRWADRGPLWRTEVRTCGGRSVVADRGPHMRREVRLGGPRSAHAEGGPSWRTEVRTCGGRSVLADRGPPNFGLLRRGGGLPPSRAGRAELCAGDGWRGSRSGDGAGSPKSRRSGRLKGPRCPGRAGAGVPGVPRRRRWPARRCAAPRAGASPARRPIAPARRRRAAPAPPAS